MDAILLLVLIPQEEKKAIFHTENEAERDTKSGERTGSYQKNKPKTICPPAMGWLKPVKNPP